MCQRRNALTRILCPSAVAALPLTLLLTGTPASAQLTITGTIRDFHVAHPDFEDFLGDDRNIVQTTLGPGQKPLYNPGDSNPTVTSAATFAQWYNDVPGVNMSAPLSLTLNPIGGGIFEYLNTSFLPIDNQLFGNEGNSHNFHFTTEFHLQFQYNPGQSFTFSGDDDVFVFINNQLAIDLGGVHPAETASVNLDTLGLTAGNTYDMDIFQAERHTTASQFRIQTNIPVVNNIPEPATGALALCGVLSLVGVRRRRK